MKWERWKDTGASGCNCQVLSGACGSWKFSLVRRIHAVCLEACLGFSSNVVSQSMMKPVLLLSLAVVWGTLPLQYTPFAMLSVHQQGRHVAWGTAACL